MSKMDELNKFIKEQENLPFNAMGERCATKTDKIVLKAQELSIPWKMIECGADNGVFNQRHIYAVIDGKKVDVAYDSDTKEILGNLINREIINKMTADESFSQKHTWREVINDLAYRVSEEARILDYSLDPKRIIFVDNEEFDRKEFEKYSSQYGLSCSFRKIKEGIVSVSFAQVGKDNFKYVMPKDERKYRREEKKRKKQMYKRWAIRDNRLRELEKE